MLRRVISSVALQHRVATVSFSRATTSSPSSSSLFVSRTSRLPLLVSASLTTAAITTMSAAADSTPAQAEASQAEASKSQASSSSASSTPFVNPTNPTSLFDLHALNSKKKDVDLSGYKGHVVLVVNVASKCGFTPQYKGLEALYKELKDQGLVILGFPCNGFGSQEPGNEAEIEGFCQVNFGVTFPLMAKIEVNGDNEHPVYKFLKSQKSGLLGMKRIKWNFEKFLVNKKGQVVERYSSLTNPEDIKAKIQELLKED